MKPSIFTSVVILSVSLCALHAEIVPDNVPVGTTGRNIKPYSEVYSYVASQPVNIQTDGFALEADSGSLIHNLSIRLTILPQKSGYSMPSDMVNVSNIVDGMRLLPNGEHFNTDNPARIRLGYNPNLIPAGYKAKDIYTYYCDNASEWHRLERLSIDTVSHCIVSLTTHFTDFANAVIRVPEMPESKAFVPTAMADLPDVNPMFGIPMIQAPSANNRGTAELTYPIDIPKGRHGLQPNVDLHYSSSGGNGILGVGWSLNFPAVTLDTRWGVPRYDPQYETEQYLVNGAAVLFRDSDGTAQALPYQTNTLVPRVGELVRFYARDTKNQDRIIRVGTNPTDYWWEVTDRNGVTTYYGRSFDPDNPQDNQIDETSVVRTDSDCIAYWAATASVDVYGNYVRYINEKEGNTVYVRQIDYTGNCNQHVPPVYRVYLSYDNRQDVSSSGRLGVLQTEEKRLCNLLVQYHAPDKPETDYTDNLAAYFMQYTPPSEITLFKSRLAEVIMLDSVHDLRLNDYCDVGDIINGFFEDRNDLSIDWLKEAYQNNESLYYQMLVALDRPYGESSIPASVTSFTYADAPSASNQFATADSIIGNSVGKELSKNHSTGWGAGGTFTVGPGPDVATTLLSGGANFDYSMSTGKCTSMLMDLNGDGLQDIIYEKNDGSVWYCRQIKQGENYSFDNEVQLQGLTCLSHEVTHTYTWGLQLSFGADLSYSNPIAQSYTDTYFADVNADGLPDMIDGEKILINHIGNDGHPFFGVYTGVGEQSVSVHNGCRDIVMDGEVDEHIECELQEILVDIYTKEDFFGQPVSTGFGAEQVIDTVIPYPQMNYTDNGVVILPGQDNVFKDIEEFTLEPPTIPTPEIPTRGKASANHSQKSSGDLIYRIVGDYVKVYRLEYICHLVKTDPEIETVRVWAAPRPGVVVLTDSIVLLADTSESRKRSLTVDGVAYTIQLCDSVVAQNDSMHLHAYSDSLLHEGMIGACDTTVHSWQGSVSVKQGDLLMFRLRSGENPRFDRTRWHHIIRYVDETTEYDSERDFLCTSEGYFCAHNGGTVRLTFTGSNDDATPVVLRVRKNEQTSPYLLETTLLQGAINLSPIILSLQAHDSIIISLSPFPGSSQEPVWSDIHVKPCIQYISDFLVNENPAQYVHDTVMYYPEVQIAHSSFFPKSSPYRKLFGPMHKGWGMFAYQNINNRDTIILDSLINTQYLTAENTPLGSSIPTYEPDIPSLEDVGEDGVLSHINNTFSEFEVYNPVTESSYWVPMRADSRTEQWIAYGNLGCIGKEVHSNEREIAIQGEVEEIVEYDSALPFSQGEERVNNFVRKESLSIQHCLSFGAIVLNESQSFGSYEAVVDYMDMNGDGYPDFVGKGGIQYSTPWGGIGKLQAVPNFSPFESHTEASGIAFSACPARLKKLGGNNIRDGKFHLSAAAGASTGFGASSTKIQFVDINADGLPDKIDVEHNTVRYNLGYQFSEPYPFYGNGTKGSNVNGSINANLSSTPFSIAQVSISGGVSESSSLNTTNELLVDINGDGLPDRIRQYGNNCAQVAYNLGNRSFGSWKPLPAINSLGEDDTRNTSTSLGATGGFTYAGIVRFDFGIQTTPYGNSSTVGNVTMTDMNGDGLIDYVSKNGNQLHVRYNTAGKANLLTSVTNPTGQCIMLEYSLSEPSIAHRSRQWNLKQIISKAPSHPMSGAVNNIVEIEYDSAYYDNYEKTDYGYEYVRTIENGKRVVKSVYHNQSLLQNGELREDSVMDDLGNMYIRHIHGIRYMNIISDNEHNGTDACDDANNLVLHDGYWTEYYEKESTPQITTRYNIVYDQYHNIIEYKDSGDITIPDDDWRQEITYLATTANNMISLPKTENVYGGSGQLLRSSSVNYSAYGEPAHIHFKDVHNNLVATTHLGYDNFGNVIAVISPEDANGENNWSLYNYDSVSYSNVVAVDNPYQVRTYTTYDYRWGLPKRIIDPAGNEMRFTYDYKGRLNTVLSPIELERGKDYTVKYDYNLINHNLKIPSTFHYTHVYKDMYDSLLVQREVSIHDQYGRILQKKHYAEVDGSDEWVVDGAEEWDAFGRVYKYEYPFVAQDAPYEYEPLHSSSAFVKTDYDVLDRPVSQTNADGSEKNMVYHFKQDLQGRLRLLTSVEDENHIVTETLKSPRGLVIQQIAGDSSSTYFRYSPIGELLRSTDAEGYQTTYAYDMLGRMVSRLHPDAGLTTLTYDLAGNMTSKQTANLAATSEDIQYIYRYGRLQEIHYPHHVENNVLYLYDPAGRVAVCQDGTGYETFIYDKLGNVAQSLRHIVVPTESNAYIFRTLFKYDSFGRVRNIIYPDGEAVFYNYTTGGLLKSVAGTKHGQRNIYLWNRLYDEQGRKTLQQVGNGVWTSYEYDADRQWLSTVHTELPGGTVLQDLQYKYDDVGNIVQIGQDAPVLSSHTLGGEYVNDYQYDRQYRLTRAIGSMDFPYSFDASYSPSGRMGNHYTQSMGPDQIDVIFGYDRQRMTHQPRTIYDTNEGTFDLFWDLNGNMAQVIGCRQYVARLHEWDEENRLKFMLEEKNTGYYGYNAGGERVYKLTGLGSVSQLNFGNAYAQAVFDDAVLYPNPYIVVTSKGYTKHYYAGIERLAAVIGTGGFDDMVTAMEKIESKEDVNIVEAFFSYYHHNDPFYQGKHLSGAVPTEDISGNKHEYLDYQCQPVSLESLEILASRDILYNTISSNEYVNGQENDVYFYHGDHLGSASWITNMSAQPVQYIHYAPYGELIANQTPYTYDERYKFTGKERDAESGYDYYGARFYWLIGNWLSVDPLADKYPNISPYAFCAWNPIGNIDMHGDSSSLALLQVYDAKNKTNLTKRLIDDLQFITGLSLSIQQNGMLDYAKNADGSPMISANGGSETARTSLITLIEASQTVLVVPGSKSMGGGIYIVIAPHQIESFIKGSYGVDNRTMGFGMTFLHEFFHTTVGGEFKDEVLSTTPVVDIMNNIRQELNHAGYNFGQRMLYRAIPRYGRHYLPFNKEAQDAMDNNRLPCDLFGEKFIWF